LSEYQNCGSGGSAPQGGTPATNDHPTLRQGSRGDAVTHLQDHLNDRGYGLSRDGNFGSGTAGAVRDFQSKNGLAADGVVGPATWNALHSGGGSAPAPAPTDPNAPYGAIGAKWNALGGANGVLGAPTTAEASTADGGRFQRFSKGSGNAIYHHPSYGTWALYGAIGATFRNFGGSSGILGYPLMDEASTSGGGRYQRFHKGSGNAIYHSSAGTYEVHGSIGARYRSEGGSGSFLGFPTSHEINAPGGRQSNFQGGSIFWNSSNGQVTVNRNGAAPAPAPSNPPANQPPANAPPPTSTGSGTRYKVRSVFNNRCVDADIAAGQNKDGGKVQQWDCISDNANQLIRLNSRGGGWYEMKFQHSPYRCVDAYAFGKTNGSAIVQWPCNGKDNQLVKKVHRGSGSQGDFYQLEFKHAPGMCLDFDSNQNRNGGKVQAWQCLSNNSNQRFYLLVR